MVDREVWVRSLTDDDDSFGQELARLDVDGDVWLRRVPAGAAERLRRVVGDLMEMALSPIEAEVVLAVVLGGNAR